MMSARSLSALKVAVLSFIVVTQLYSPHAEAGNEMREFITSCTYGVMAGTLVGAAMLAFTDQPGENLSKVARGASLGLYVGILLGAYVIYIVPGDDEPDPDMLNGPSESWREPKVNTQWALVPSVEKNRVDGAALFGEVYRF